MPITAANAKSFLDVASDLVSAPRNIINGATKGLSLALPFLVIVQGILAFITGSYTAATSFWETRQAIAKRDERGKALSAFGTLGGLAQMALGCSATTCGSATKVGRFHIFPL